MSKPPSDATLLRTARRELNYMKKELRAVVYECDHYRARATKAEQEAADWRKRFDSLLDVTKQPRNADNG